MSKVNPWKDSFRFLKDKHTGNNIDKQNVTAIDTYNAIEGSARLKVKYSGLEGLYIRRKGERL